MTFIHLDRDILTTQQKIDYARHDFISIRGDNDSVKWKECGMYRTA